MRSKFIGVAIMGVGIGIVCLGLLGCLETTEGRVYVLSMFSNSLFVSACYSCYRERQRLERGA